MAQKRSICFPIVTILLLLGLSIAAQPPKKTVAPPITKFKPPIVKSYLGKFTGTKATASVEEGKLAITWQIKITDDKNYTYSLSSYQFAYKRIGMTEDEATGKTSPETDLVAQRFTVTPLPEVWQGNIIESLHKGEELYFFDIIAIDKQGRRFFVPEIKITIQ